MPQAISSDHQWVVAANVSMPEGLAKQAKRRGTVRVPQNTKVEVLEVYCGQCRRPWERVHGTDCIAAENRDHLIGGPTGERKKRGHAADPDEADADHVAAV